MAEYGLIGEKLGHSFSREIHSRIGEYDYSLIELNPGELDEFLNKKEFKAVNVTIPYKKTVIPYMDKITEAASEIGAVNCIKNDGGHLIGHNTDFDGLYALIKHSGIEIEGKKVLILGTGGTSDTAKAVVKSLKAGETIKVSRSRSLKSGQAKNQEGKVVTYDEAYLNHKDAQVIINATPSGMYPDIYTGPVSLEAFEKLEGVIDVIYNPLKSRMVMSALERGLKAEGGLYMLVAQAVSASEFFMGTKYSKELTENIYKEILREKINIVLTGMPGSGKSTIGKKIAAMTGREFYDTDELISENVGMSISDMFKKYGEEYFRDREAEAVSELALKSGIVIATGGGAILRKENTDNLKMNGQIVFLDRAPELIIPTADRPTAFDRQQLCRRYKERYPIYRASADMIIENNGTAKEAIQKIMEERDEICHYKRT